MCAGPAVRAGRRTAVLMGIAVGVPAAALELEGRGGDQFAHWLSAFRAGAQGRIGDVLVDFKGFLASAAFVLVNRHGILRFERQKNKENANRVCSRVLPQRLNAFTLFHWVRGRAQGQKRSVFERNAI